MKNKAEDNGVKRKIESLDTLSVGIVYGKEEAWEKLQERMEKPKRRIPVAYWLAAAVLIPVIILISIFKQPVVQLAQQKEGAKTGIRINSPENRASSAPVQVAPFPEQPEKIAVQKIFMTKGNAPERQRKIVKKEAKEEVVIVQDTSVAPVAAGENKISADTLLSVSAAPVNKPMKVVHINDLEQAGAKQNSMVSNLSPGIDISKMRVLHINDAVLQEFYLREIYKHNRNSFVRSFFAKPMYYDENNSTNEAYFPPRNFLKMVREER